MSTAQTTGGSSRRADPTKAAVDTRNKPNQKISIRNEDETLQRYLQEVHGYPLLETSQVYELAHRIQEGDHQAFNILVEANLRFVVKLAKGYRGLGLPLTDLINEGNLGLMEAVWRFDPNRGVRFLSYAVWWIRKGILIALNEQSGVIRVPSYHLQGMRRIGATRNVLAQELHRQPTIAEVAERMGIEPARVTKHQKPAPTAVPLTNVVDEEQNLQLSDTLADHTFLLPDEQIDRVRVRQHIRIALDELSEQERMVLAKRFGLDGSEPMTLKEIGHRLGVTRERVRQIETAALLRLRRFKNINALRGCVI